jgi:flagellar motility protein MotE (MotC chaperone)
MTRIFVACLVAFPLIFVGMLAATGTLGALWSQVRVSVEETFSFGGDDDAEEAETPGYGVLDSLVVADVEARERHVESAMDSMEVIQTQIATERQELAHLSSEIQGLVAQLMSMEQSMEVTRQREKKAIAKIVGNMEPEAAAMILNALDPEATEFLIKSIPARQAAEILALMPPQTSAPMIDRILNPRDGVGQGEPR